MHTSTSRLVYVLVPPVFCPLLVLIQFPFRLNPKKARRERKNPALCLSILRPVLFFSRCPPLIHARAQHTRHTHTDRQSVCRTLSNISHTHTLVTAALDADTIEVKRVRSAREDARTRLWTTATHGVRGGQKQRERENIVTKFETDCILSHAVFCSCVARVVSKATCGKKRCI